jgi:predicted DNA-binding transcriptional regulator AlpA
MDAIAQVVGVSRATLYRHIGNNPARPATGRSKKTAKNT